MHGPHVIMHTDPVMIAGTSTEFTGRSGVTVAALDAARRRLSGARTPRRAGERPVVILPGVYETWHFLRPIADALNRRGHPVHVCTPWASTATRSRRPRRSSPASWPPSTCATSRSSRTARAGSSASTCSRSTTRTAGSTGSSPWPTPFGGSRLARYTVGSTLRAFLPGDPVIRSLADERAVNARITSIYPRFDPNIPEGSRLEGATNVELPLVGHFRILTAPEALAAVVAAVEAE